MVAGGKARYVAGGEEGEKRTGGGKGRAGGQRGGERVAHQASSNET